jgi:hypothetical protein
MQLEVINRRYIVKVVAVVEVHDSSIDSGGEVVIVATSSSDRATGRR